MVTLYDKIREAVFREPRLGAGVTRTVGNVEVFNTEAAKAPEPAQGGLDMARAGHQDGDRINSLTATVAAIQAVVATDPQQGRDLAHFARYANDAIRVHSGLVK